MTSMPLAHDRHTAAGSTQQRTLRTCDRRLLDDDGKNGRRARSNSGGARSAIKTRNPNGVFSSKHVGCSPSCSWPRRDLKAGPLTNEKNGGGGSLGFPGLLLCFFFFFIKKKSFFWAVVMLLYFQGLPLLSLGCVYFLSFLLYLWVALFCCHAIVVKWADPI